MLLAHMGFCNFGTFKIHADDWSSSYGHTIHGFEYWSKIQGSNHPPTISWHFMITSLAWLTGQLQPNPAISFPSFLPIYVYPLPFQVPLCQLPFVFINMKAICKRVTKQKKTKNVQWIPH